MKVLLNGHYSRSFYINAGITQESILWPILFLFSSMIFLLASFLNSASILMMQLFTSVSIRSLINTKKSNWQMISKMTYIMLGIGSRSDLFILTPLKAMCPLFYFKGHLYLSATWLMRTRRRATHCDFWSYVE